MTTHTLTSPRAHPSPATERAEHTVPSWLALFGFILLCNAAGFLGNLVGGQDLYGRLNLPSWAPSSHVFGPVWIILYALMGIATWLVWRTPADSDRREALGWFAVQLVLNAAWTPVFFGLESLAGGLVILVALCAAVTGMIIAYARRSSLAAVLLAPLWLWVGFAATLNAAIWWLNR